MDKQTETQVIFLKLKNIVSRKYVRIEELYKVKREYSKLKGILNKVNKLYTKYEEKRDPYKLARELKNTIRF